MKHLRLFEKLSTQSIKNTVNDYNNMIKKISPGIKEKYDELAEKGYEPDYGDDLYVLDSEEQLVFQGLAVIDSGFECCLQSFDHNGQIRGTFYIVLTNEDVDNLLIKMDTKKYNL